MSVEPRKYRLRLFIMSLSRPYEVYIEDDAGNRVDFPIIASDSVSYTHLTLPTIYSV